MKKHKKGILKYFSLALVLVAGVLGIQKVNAETNELTFSHSGYWWQRTSPSESTHGWYTEDYYFGDRVAYCIEPGVTEGKTYNVGTLDNTSYSNEVKDKILLIAYYGYDYPGHQNLRYRMTAQALIWESVGNYQITYSTQRWNQGTIIDLSAERNEIMSFSRRMQVIQ